MDEFDRIEGKDLRYENWVLYQGKPRQVIKIEPEREYAEFKGAVTLRAIDREPTNPAPWLKDIEPIPLTDEWVRQLGFEFNPRITKSLSSGRYSGSTAYTRIDPLREVRVHIIMDDVGQFDQWEWRFEEETDGGEHPIQIMIGSEFYYVHELQNRYQSFTHQELPHPVHVPTGYEPIGTESPNHPTVAG